MKLLFSLFFFSTLIASAQLTWSPGYVVLTSGDTLRGVVNDQQWVKSPTSIDFKTEEGSETIQYATDDIKSFCVLSRSVTYVSFSFQFDGDMIGHYMGRFNNPTPGFPRSRLPQKWVNQTAFLQRLLVGSFSLFIFVDEEERKHYFLLQPKQSVPDELQYHTYLVTVEGTDKLATSEYYKYQFQQVSGACPDLDPAIKRLKYVEQALIDFMVKLNKCHGSEVSYEKKAATKSKILLGVVGAGSLFGFYDFHKFHLSNVKGGLGLSLETFSKSRPNRQSFYNELKWIPFSESAKFGPTFRDRKLKFNSIKVNTMFRVYSRNTKTYFGLGMINGVIFNLKTNDAKFLNTTVPETGISIGVGHCFSEINTSLEFRMDQNFSIQASDPNVFVGVGPYGTIGLLLTKQFNFK